MFYLDVEPTFQILWMLPLGMIFSTMIAVGIGMLVAPLNAISQDVQHLFRFIVAQASSSLSYGHTRWQPKE